MLFYLQVVPPLETGKTICKDKVHKTIVHDPRIKVGHLADVIVTDDWRTLSFPTGSDAQVHTSESSGKHNTTHSEMLSNVSSCVKPDGVECTAK